MKITTRKLFAKALILLIVLSFWTNSAAQIQTKTASKSKSVSFGNVKDVTAAKMRQYLEFIASDELEGHDTPSRGLDIAAMYIAGHLANWASNRRAITTLISKKSRLKETELTPP